MGLKMSKCAKVKLKLDIKFHYLLTNFHYLLTIEK